MELKHRLNTNDYKLLAFTQNEYKTISEISKHLGIAPKNVSVRLDRLEAMSLIDIYSEKRGRKTYVKAKDDSRLKEFYKKILKKLEENGGSMKEEQFQKIINSEEDLRAMSILWTDLVDRDIKINKEGKKFLEENE